MLKALKGTKSRTLTSMRVLKDPFFWMERWRAKFGDPFLLQTLNGPVVMTANPDAIKQIFTANATIHRPFAVDNTSNLVGKNSLFLQHGEPHKRQRKLLIPPFHGKRMKAYANTMALMTRSQIEKLALGEPFKMIEFGQALTLNVILSAIFGFTDEQERQAFATVVERHTEALHPSFIFAARLQHPLWAPWRRFLKSRSIYNQAITDQIIKLRPVAHQREDILSLMLEAQFDDGLRMTDQELIDQLNTLLIAGHETTSVTLSWAMYWLFRTPMVLTRLREEVEALGPRPEPEAYTKLPYLNAVVKETLRIRPVVTEVLRTLNQPFKLLNIDLEPGMTMSPSVSLLHADPEIYPEPDTFRPERFLERSFSPYEYIPFGGGNRRCIGSAFAEFELRIALAILISEVDLDLIDDHIVRPVRKNILMAPEGGIQMKLLRRIEPEEPTS